MSVPVTRLVPPTPSKKPEHNNSYDGSKLFYVEVDLNAEGTQQHLATARDFCRAEADNDIDDMMDLLESGAHFGTFWGIVRGRTSITVALAAERKHRIVFTTPLRTVTNNTFEREGYVQRGDAHALGKIWHKMKRIPLRESLIFGQDGQIAFRQLHLKAHMFW